MTTTTTDLAIRRELREHAGIRTAMIPLGKLRVHPSHIRSDMGDLTELASSLAHDGQHQALEVERRGSFYVILDGHRRFGAAAIAGLARLRADIVPARSTADAVTTMLTTGTHTKPITAAERTHAVRILIDAEHLSVGEIAARCGVSGPTIRRWYAGTDTTISTDASPASEPDTAAPGIVGQPRRTCPAPRRGKPRIVGVRRIAGLIDRWSTRCQDGLSGDAAQDLLAEMNALITGHDDAAIRTSDDV
ncbi:ParB/RepB/Spo0J family partition protein [Amycolatopsis sp. NPDC051903]|uniref:ParB/RepB/Spo0J family partition protein n=1 Tax=Amycolatopsis sp. NPDC051903 TaxID=3363936 RepID=UPI00379E57BD